MWKVYDTWIMVGEVGVPYSGIGEQFDVVDVDRHLARVDLLLTNKAVYASPFDLEYYARKRLVSYCNSTVYFSIAVVLRYTVSLLYFPTFICLTLTLP